MNGTRPSGLALVLCDNLYLDRHGKRALVGLFNRITAHRFPAVHRKMVVYVSVTDVRADTRFRLDIVHGETDQPVFHTEGPPPQDVGPTTILEFVFEIENVPFPEPATYFIRFWGNEYILLQRPIQLVGLHREGNERELGSEDEPDERDRT